MDYIIKVVPKKIIEDKFLAGWEEREAKARALLEKRRQAALDYFSKKIINHLERKGSACMEVDTCEWKNYSDNGFDESDALWALRKIAEAYKEQGYSVYETTFSKSYHIKLREHFCIR